MELQHVHLRVEVNEVFPSEGLGRVGDCMAITVHHLCILHPHMCMHVHVCNAKKYKMSTSGFSAICAVLRACLCPYQTLLGEKEPNRTKSNSNPLFLPLQ